MYIYIYILFHCTFLCVDDVMNSLLETPEMQPIHRIAAIQKSVRTEVINTYRNKNTMSSNEQRSAHWYTWSPDLSFGR